MEICNGRPQPENVSEKYVKATYFEIVASGVTSGTITKPASNGPDVSFVMDSWGTDTDALVSTMAGGKPTWKSPVDSGGSVISTTFNTSGEFAFSGTPSPAGDHAVIYVYKCYLKNFDADESLFESELYAQTSDHNHNDLSNLDGGTPGEYYHFTSSQHTEVAAFFGSTDITGAEAETLTDDSMADALHRHSELSASDGTPNQALVVDANGKVFIGTGSPRERLEVKANEDTYIAISITSSGQEAGLKFRDTTNSWEFLAEAYNVDDGYEFGLNYNRNEFMGHFYVANNGSKLFVIEPNGKVIANAHVEIKNQNELRFYDNGNYIGFEAPALSADQIWVLPTADGADGDVLTTDGAGTLSWLSGASEKSWGFRSRSGASGTTYAGGFYKHSGTANDFSGGPTFGTANAAYGAHFFVVLGAQTVDELTLTVTGTSVTDAGVRTAADTENIVLPNSTPVDSYYETAKKWIGQVTITVASGTAKTCDFGFAKYWDNNNSDFAVVGLEATWLGGATDTGANIILRHHKGTAGNTDWTYTGSGATPPTAVAAMSTDYSTEDNVISGEDGAWKRTNLATSISGSGSEGTIVEVVTTANRAFTLGTFLMRITPQ